MENMISQNMKKEIIKILHFYIKEIISLLRDSHANIFVSFGI